MDRIVVGVDPSPAGRQALAWAVREAVARSASLTAVRAWLVAPLGYYYPVGSGLGEGTPQAQADAQQLAQDELKLACEQVPGADRLETRATEAMGSAAQVLVDAAAQADLLVVGSRGAGVLSRALLGSVSTAVLHHAACPVAVVPGAAVAGPPPRVLVGVDHSPSSQAALVFAVAMARRHDAVLVPVHVHEPMVAQDDRQFDVRMLEESERRSLIEAARDAGADGLRVQPEVCTGHAAAGLTTLAEPDDVLVTGSRGRGGFPALLLGSTSTHTAQHATCAVIVVRS